MKVIVCGAGQVGFNIARYLSAEDAHAIISTWRAAGVKDDARDDEKSDLATKDKG